MCIIGNKHVYINQLVFNHYALAYTEFSINTF
jgi:hypothetical protein